MNTIQPQPTPRPSRPPSNIAAAPVATQSITPMVDGIPIDIIDYFNIDTMSINTRENNQLIDIYKLLKNDGDSDSDVILKIGEIERKLGYPAHNETRYGKVWSYVKINSRIIEMEKQKKAMELAGDR